MDSVIKVEGLHKKFCRSLRRSMYYGSVDMFRSMVTMPVEHTELRKAEFWALQDINFELKRGETLGLIGQNGCGKSTLLRLLNGIFPPDKGKITINGRIGALIAVGAGFHPHMTGRENIYLNGTILGMTKDEIKRNLDAIIDFAEIGEFIDSPVSTYSSGMTVRLGFAIAIHCEPDILLIDEILAVGDMNFQIKCGNRIRKISEHTAVIFVSHSMQNVSWFCSKVIVMKDGKIFKDASSTIDGINTYLSMNIRELEISTTGSGGAGLNNLRLFGENGIILQDNPTINQNEIINIEVDMFIDGNFNAVSISLAILDETGTGIIFLPLKDKFGLDALFPNGKYILHINIGKIELNIGKYNFLFVVKDSISKYVLNRTQGISPFNVYGSADTYAKIVRNVTAEII